MPVNRCRSKDGRPGYRWGDRGPCYPFTAGNPVSRKQAYAKVRRFAYAVSPREAKAYFSGARKKLA
jgi:hypothetical protein